MGGNICMTKTTIKAGIISDANVLIDYAKSAPDLLRLISKHVQTLYIPLPVLKEVDQLSIKEVLDLGIVIVEPTLLQIIEATKIRMKKPSLSGEDAICFVMARDKDWTCLTNDKPLRTICSLHKIHCIWGLEIMLYLVSAKVITDKKAYHIAQDIQSKNKYIKMQTLKRFKEKLDL